MMAVGPFPMRAIVVALAALVAWGVARAIARRRHDAEAGKATGALVIDALFVGLLAARLAYVLAWWRDYASAPMSVIQIGDGGFVWWAGLAAGLAFVAWRTRAARMLRRPAFAGIAAGTLAWAVANGALWWMQQSAPSMPDIALQALDDRPVALGDYAGRPVVVNLWATWCPPCRREMPVLERAQAAYPGVSFVLVNQGEDLDTIRRYLDEEGLALRDVLRDPHSRTMAETGARALPTTLFFDASGRLVDSHMGELTRASLADTLRRRFDARALPDPGLDAPGDKDVAASESPLRDMGDGLYASGQPAASQWAAIRDRGITTVVNLRPDGEMQGRDEATEVAEAGLAYRHLPISGGADITAQNAERLAAMLRDAPGPVLLHCASGNRVGALLALIAAQDGASREEALERGRQAGMTSLEVRVRELVPPPVDTP